MSQASAKLYKKSLHKIKIKYALLLFQRNVLAFSLCSSHHEAVSLAQRLETRKRLSEMKETIPPIFSTVVFMATSLLKLRHCNCIKEYLCFKE